MLPFSDKVRFESNICSSNFYLAQKLLDRSLMFTITSKILEYGLTFSHKIFGLQKKRSSDRHLKGSVARKIKIRSLLLNN